MMVIAFLYIKYDIVIVLGIQTGLLNMKDHHS